MMRCACYARFSSDRQSPTSIADQIRKCREFATRQGWALLDEHTYTDEAVSATSAERAGLQRLLAAATSTPRPFDCILIDDTSRLSRKLSDALRIFEQLSFANIRLVFVSQGIDTGSEQAEVLLATHGIVDSLYIRELAKKVHRGMEGRALAGLHTGGRCFGYRRVPIEDPTRTDSYGRPLIVGVRLEVDESEAAVVRRIFEMYAGGHSLKKITFRLNAEGVSSPQPQKGRLSRSWCPSSIRTILHNDRYRGLVVWGRTRKLRSPETGKRIYRRRQPTEWLMIESPEQRIVSDNLWERTQQRFEQVKAIYGNLGRKAGLLRARAAGSGYLFSGLLKCGLCGANLSIVSGAGKRHRYASYGCPMHANRRVCDNALRIRADVIERGLLEKLQAQVLRPEVVEYTLGRFEVELLKRLDDLGDELDRLRRREVVLRRQIANLTRGLAEGYQSPAVMGEIAARERELEEITRHLLDSKPDSVRARIRNIRGFVLSQLSDLRGLLNSDPMAAKAEMAKHVHAIKLTPAGKAYKVEADWELLGGSSEDAGGRNRTAYAGLFRAALYR